MAVNVTNNGASPLGLWSVDPEYDVIGGFGADGIVDPDMVSAQIIDLYVAAGEIVTFAGAEPENTVAPAVTGTAQVGETLTCSAGTWTGTPTIEFSYQWQSSEDGDAGWADIAEATVETYDPVEGDVDAYLRCAVTGSNDYGDSTSYSNVVGPVLAE